MTIQPTGPGELRKGVGLGGVVMFGAGTAIGVSIFSVLQPAAEVAGSALLGAMALAALPMLLFAVSYAWLGSALPVSGASYEWPRRFLGPLAGFLIAWLRIISNVGALIVLAQVLVNYLGMVIPMPSKLVMAAALTAVFALNYVGVAVAARVQILLMLMLLLVLGIFVAAGAPLVSISRIGSPLGTGFLAVAAAVPLMISLFLGIESAVEIGEEIRNPRRNIPLGIGLAIGLTVIVYGAVAVTALGLVGPEQLAVSPAPLLDAAQVPLGDLAVPLIVGAAAVSILKTMNATALVFSRSLFAMGRSGVLPERLASIHPRFGTPHAAIILGYCCAMLGLFLPSSLVFLLLAVNIPTMLKYFACSLCALRVARDHPEIAATAQLALSRRTVRWVARAACVAALLIIAAGLGADWRPYVLVGGWLVLGVLYWVWRSRTGRGVPATG
ncbi:MAG TPA: APC family permease [Sphingomicrobium sp.]|nr:APC family permease [Sphingomicrobium sp.]